MSLACANCPVRNQAACSVLSSEERETLAKAGRRITLKRGETLFHAGDPDPVSATLVSGGLKVCVTQADGTERILALVHPAGFTGEMFQPFAHHDVVALGDSELCVFSQSEMSSALSNHPALTKALFRRSQEDLHQSRTMLALNGQTSASAKIASLLLSFAEAASDSPCHQERRFDLPLNRTEIAGFLGLTVETVSRQLSRLTKAGVIAKHGSRGIELVDPPQLRQISEQGS